MLSVRDVAATLPERFVATLRTTATLEGKLIRMRLQQHALTKRPRKPQVAIRDEARRVLRSWLRELERDTALLAFADALSSVEARSFADLKRNAELIRERADTAAGFDVLKAFKANKTSKGPDDFPDIENVRGMLADNVRSRLLRTPLAVLLELAHAISEGELAHELRTAFERLDALALRATVGWNPRLRDAANLYIDGKLEIADVARLLGSSPSDVAAEFERLGFVRPLQLLRLSDEKRRELAARALRAPRLAHAEAVAREVIASQRIEGIDARRHVGRAEISGDRTA